MAYTRPVPDGSTSVTSHDDDILDFDFFEEDATRESSAGDRAERDAPGHNRREAAAAGRGDRGSRRRTA